MKRKEFLDTDYEDLTDFTDKQFYCAKGARKVKIRVIHKIRVKIF